ncbi:hypothetical protein E4U41_005556 [Claviceps citrina]|nr:hypothetical protein E4U41_005556 [Claviceps citrina]
MKVAKAALLCAAGLLACPSSKQPRFLRRRDVAVNATSEASTSASTSTSTAAHDDSSIPSSPRGASFSPSFAATTRSTGTRISRSRFPRTASPSPSPSSPSSYSNGTGPGSSTTLDDRSASKRPASSPTGRRSPSYIKYTPSSHSNTTTITTTTTTTTTTLGAKTPQEATQASHSTYSTKVMDGTTICPTGKIGRCHVIRITTQTMTAIPTTTVYKHCTPLPHVWQPIIIYSIVHTSTVTFLGNRSHYTPLYPLIVTPHYCSPNYTIGSPPPTGSGVGGLGPQPLPHTTGLPVKLPSLPPGPKITFITTDKNPLVLFPSDPRPGASHRTADPYPDPVIHKTAAADATQPGSIPATHRRRPTFSITARGDQVIIDRQIFSLAAGSVAVVAVDGGEFTIYPTAVVGEGGIVTKPPPPPAELTVPAPTSGLVGDLNVTLSGAELVIGGVEMTIPPYKTTTLIHGESVTMSPYFIAVGTSVFTFRLTQPPPETDVVVNGGEMLTAIGKTVVVLHQTTLTYGPGIPPRTEVVDEDTITIGPSGVLVHGVLLGGPTAGANDTRLEIIGGATITRIAPSVAIINGRTFTICPALSTTTTTTTTVIAGQTFTIGPHGLAVSTLTMTVPFGASVVGTIVPAGTWLSHFPLETAGSASATDEDKDSAGAPPLFRAGMSLGRRGGVAVCMVIGVLVLG